MTKRKGTRPASLGALARAIKEFHGKCLEGVRSSLKYARETGLRLIEAKERVRDELGKNQWQSWVRLHCEIDLRVAQNYVQIARHPEDLLSDPDGECCLTITEALRRIRSFRAGGKEDRCDTPDGGSVTSRQSEDSGDDQQGAACGERGSAGNASGTGVVTPVTPTESGDADRGTTSKDVGFDHTGMVAAHATEVTNGGPPDHPEDEEEGDGTQTAHLRAAWDRAGAKARREFLVGLLSQEEVGSMIRELLARLTPVPLCA